VPGQVGRRPELLQQQHRVVAGIVGKDRSGHTAHQDFAGERRRPIAIEAGVPKTQPVEPQEALVAGLAVEDLDRIEGRRFRQGGTRIRSEVKPAAA
jgi:hypothetical protein